MTELNLEKEKQIAYPYWKVMIVYTIFTGLLSSFITGFIWSVVLAANGCHVLSCYFKFIIEQFFIIYLTSLFSVFITMPVVFLFALVIVLNKVSLSICCSFPIAMLTFVFYLIAFFILYSILGLDMLKGSSGTVAISVSLSSGFSSWIVWRFLIAEDHKISKK